MRRWLSKSSTAVLAFLLIGTLVRAQETTPDSLDIKIGQMIIIGVKGNAVSESDKVMQEIAEGKVGGIILYEKNINAKESYINFKKLTWALQQKAPIPLFMAIDQEGGFVNRLKEKYDFPKSVSAAYLGNVDNLDSTRFYNEITAATLAGLGVNVNFAPVVDLATNPDNPIIAKYERAYSDNPEIVARHAREAIAAHNKMGVVTVLKHFPGHGSSKSDTHLGIADVTKYWQQIELDPYKAAIDSGYIDAIMTAHIVNKSLDTLGLPGTLSKSIMTGLLRDSLNYEGVIFSDDMQMRAISDHFGLEKSIRLSIEAGVDVLMFSNNIRNTENRTVDTVHRIIRELIEEGVIDESRIDQSYRRILKLKHQIK